MKKSQVKKAKKIVERELNKIGKKLNWYDKPVVDIRQSEHNKDWWAVEIRTDGDSYADFYDVFGRFRGYNYQRERLHRQVEKAVNKEFGWREGEHYLEEWGQGILVLF
ncbi:MAG: hypothetical protein ACE5KE_00690 [Methanosarcinales archaeon]